MVKHKKSMNGLIQTLPSAVSRRILIRWGLPYFLSWWRLISFRFGLSLFFIPYRIFLSVFFLAHCYWFNHDLHLEVTLGFVSKPISNRHYNNAIPTKFKDIIRPTDSFVLTVTHLPDMVTIVVNNCYQLHIFLLTQYPSNKCVTQLEFKGIVVICK